MATLSDRNTPYIAPTQSLWGTTELTINTPPGTTPSLVTGEQLPYLDRRDSIKLDEVNNPNDIAATLIQRGNRYGKFTGHAKITQSLKRVMHETDNWKKLSDDQKESLEMVCHKMGRILNGDPDYDDSWIDIAGYAKLVGDRLTTGTET